MEKSLSDIKPFRVLALIRIHPSSHSFVQLTTVNNFPGTPQRADITHSSSQAMKSMHKRVLLACPTFSSPRTTNSMSTADCVGRKPLCIWGSKPLASKFWLSLDATMFNRHFTEWAKRQISR